MQTFFKNRVNQMFHASNSSVRVCFYAITCVTVFPIVSVAQDAGSADQPAVQQKQIVEPLHRVTHGEIPKVATNILPPRKAGNAVLPVKSAMPPVAILPSAIKPIREPETIEPAVPVAEPVVEPVAEPAVPRHPLDDALETARRGLENMRTNVKDYSAIMVKRERVNGELLKPEYMQVKIRNRTDSTPLSMYMKFLKPRKCSGREVIWIEGQNNNQLCVHEGSGIISLKTFNLDPDGWMAMQGNRYPIYEAGIENLIVKLIEKAERDKAAGHCEVKYRSGAKLNGRSCSVIEVCHPVKKAPYDFCNAKVYIDDELKMPIRYSAHVWPEDGGKPQLLEEYTFLNLKLNQGFTDADFDPSNPAYKFPGR